MAQGSVFLNYIRHVFKKWVGYQAALDAGMGGPYAKEKEEWMMAEIENYFKRYAGVKPEDIEEHLRTILENEFDTYFEDGSLSEVSNKFCIAYLFYFTNPNDQLFEDCNKTPEIKLNGLVSQQMMDEQQVVACEKMEQLTLSGNEEDDGWTAVTRKNKRNN